MSTNLHDCPAAPASDPQIAVSLLSEISRSEEHFNTLEASYRKLASSWLLGAFAAMGFIATAKDLPVPSGLTIFLIAVAASLGIQLLGTLDMVVYHRLLLSHFLEGLRLERMHPSLPQVRGNMISQGSTGARVRFFYLGSALIPLAFGVGAYFAIGHAEFRALPDLLVILAACALVSTCVVLMIKAPATKWMRSRISVIYPSCPPRSGPGWERKKPPVSERPFHSNELLRVVHHAAQTSLHESIQRELHVLTESILAGDGVGDVFAAAVFRTVLFALGGNCLPGHGECPARREDHRRGGEGDEKVSHNEREKRNEGSNYSFSSFPSPKPPKYTPVHTSVARFFVTTPFSRPIRL
jgi:hypothetical protein